MLECPKLMINIQKLCVINYELRKYISPNGFRLQATKVWFSGVSCELALKAEYEVEPDGDIQRATHVIPGDEPQKSKWNPNIK